MDSTPTSSSKPYTISTGEPTPPPEVSADFETAISATKWGKFNVLLFLLCVPAFWTAMFETTTMSYVFPAAHCDLRLTLADKGSLNAITFLGMITSGFFWGLLCDILGRRKMMIIGYLVDGSLVLLSSFSQNLVMLIVTKYLGGLIINGPFSAMAAYISEFHCTRLRSRVQLMRTMIVSFGAMVLPLLAWAILPQPIHVELFDAVTLRSWNIYLMVCAAPSLVSGTIFLFMPESPKFLMAVGRNREALEVFKTVFSCNTGKSKEEFPIRELVDETGGGRVTANRSKRQVLKEGLQQIKPLCYPPYLGRIILVCTLQGLILMSVNTLRLWWPQIFQSISDYQYYHNGTSSDLCTMLQMMKGTPEPESACQVMFSSEVYINTVIIASTQMCGCFLTSLLINRLGKKFLLVGLMVAAAACSLSLYFAQNTQTVLALASLFLAFGVLCTSIMITVVVDAFSTSLRAMAVSLVMMLGRSGSMIGNFFFPLLLSLGCAPPFITIGCLILTCAILTFLLPDTELKPLK